MTLSKEDLSLALPPGCAELADGRAAFTGGGGA